MILDFKPATNLFTVTVDLKSGAGYGDPQVRHLMKDYGLMYSSPASTAWKALMFTPEPYAAAPFAGNMTAVASAHPMLQHIVREAALSQAPHSGSHYDVPVDQELWDYQKADLDYMLARKSHGVLDADQPGLGKTPTAIVYCNEIRAEKILVVCPAVIRWQWLAKFKEWSTMAKWVPDWESRTRVMLSARYAPPHDTTVCIVSYNLIGSRGFHDALLSHDWDVVILDESQNLKTPGSKRTKAMFGGRLHTTVITPGIASKARHVVALTGTPMMNRPKEIYTMARHLCFESIDWLSEEKFADRFNPYELVEEERPDPDRPGHMKMVRYVKEESGRHAELQMRLRSNFMCRHLKAEVLTQLDLPVYDLVRAEDTDAVKVAREHEQVALRQATEKLGLDVNSLLEIDPEILLRGLGVEGMGHIATARQEMGVALAPQAAAYCENLLDGGVDKLVLFYWHIAAGDVLQKLLHKYGVARVDGSTSSKLKESEKTRFIEDPACRVMMGNVLTLGTGTDGLQKVSSYCVIAEPDWVPANNEQCVDRLNRGGQRNQVNADLFVAQNTVAERVLSSALRKAKVIHNALDRKVA